MNKKELKELVKKYFNLTEINNIEEETAKQVFAEATLVDGTKVTNKMEGDFEVGQELYVITEEGEEVAAPSGEHATESGIVVTVDEAGMITGIHHPDQEGEGSLEEMQEAEMEPSREDIIEAIAEIVMPEIEAMKSEMSSCMERLAKYEEKMAEYEDKMKEYMSATPASESKTTAKFSKTSIKNSEGPKYNKRRYDVTLAKLTNR